MKIIKHATSIQVSFIVEGKGFDLKEFTEKLDILPTETRGIDDWPETIKQNASLSEALQPRCVWCICQKGSGKQIEPIIRKIVAQLEGKEETLLALCKRKHLKKSLMITVQAEAMVLPELVLSPFAVSYFGKLETEIGFDLYL